MINNVAKIFLVPSMSICLLGLVEELVPMVAEWPMIGLFFYARKAITLSCQKDSPHPLPFGKIWSMSNSPLNKDTYANRGCPEKYDKVWSKWLAKPYSSND